MEKSAHNLLSCYEMKKCISPSILFCFKVMVRECTVALLTSSALRLVTGFLSFFPALLALLPPRISSTFIPPLSPALRVLSHSQLTVPLRASQSPSELTCAHPFFPIAYDRSPSRTWGVCQYIYNLIDQSVRSWAIIASSLYYSLHLLRDSNASTSLAGPPAPHFPLVCGHSPTDSDSWPARPVCWPSH